MMAFFAPVYLLIAASVVDALVHGETESSFHKKLMRRVVTRDSDELASDNVTKDWVIYGPTHTTAEHQVLLPQALNEMKNEWVFCSPQWAACQGCPGKMRWGNNGKWLEIEPRKAALKCDYQHLGDVAPGDDGKHCECSAFPGSAFYKALNPAMRPKPPHSSAAISCDTFEKDKLNGHWGLKQWEAVEAFCSSDWESSQGALPDLKAGPRALPAESLRELMSAWVDPRFKDNYERFYKDGWLDRAFVNYFAEFGSGKHTNMTEQLIRSVHLFSSYPIVVFHFGMATPTHWDVDLFPRLVLFHAAPIPNNKRSFNFNKMRSMLLARVKTGVELDSDQFVAPGIDAIFPRTEEEISDKYRFPIMTAHFLTDKGPQDGGSWWPRFCSDVKKSMCTRQTMRWAHAHPTWTYWALPFVGRWLRRQFRDENLPAVFASLPSSSEEHKFDRLVVANIPEDEDLLNVALWEEGATKQWCKFDVPDPSNFESFLRMGETSSNFTRDGGSFLQMDLMRDPRFHPQGVPEVFYSAHHAVEPDVSMRFIKRIEADRLARKLPPPIVYRGRVFSDGLKLQAVYPEVNCLI